MEEFGTSVTSFSNNSRSGDASTSGRSPPRRRGNRNRGAAMDSEETIILAPGAQNFPGPHIGFSWWPGENSEEEDEEAALSVDVEGVSPVGRNRPRRNKVQLKWSIFLHFRP